MRGSWGALVLACGLGVLAACQRLSGFEEFEAAAVNAGGSGGSASGNGGTGQAGSTAGTAGQTGCPAAPNTQDGRPMVALRNSKGDCFWIDTHEVTRDDYQAFLDSPQKPTQEPYCSDDPFPTAGCEDKALNLLDATDALKGKCPQTCVDWCDALQFCVWAGKTLCEGTFASTPTLETSWWFTACSSNDPESYRYPYGDVLDANRCQTQGPCSAGPCLLAPVTAKETCSTPSGIYNLAGNAEEWVRECNSYGGPKDLCRVYGGSARSNPSDTKCSSLSSRSRDFADEYTGFRCCLGP